MQEHQSAIVTDQTLRHFLFLQGPHGPFFSQLAKMLQRTSAKTSRIGFNAGDRAFWRDKGSFTAFQNPHADWPAFLEDYVESEKVTDIVLYGDVRPIHAEALAMARTKGIRAHTFEEGYLRPYWVTYERGGTNGHSRLMRMSVAEMSAKLDQSDADTETPPAHWGDMRQHIFYSAIYHWFLLAFRGRYENYQGHRKQPLSVETLAYTKRLVLMPFFAVDRWQATQRIRMGGYPYHLALLQLEHDASFQAHSTLKDNEEFIDILMQGFAEGAPAHHHLVFKAHPLEAERVPLKQVIRNLSAKHSIKDRVHYVRGGKLAQILDHAKSAVTVNSTSAQQALWRGMPLKTFGTSVYAKPEFTSQQPLAEFFNQPSAPNLDGYKAYRKYLLSTCQVPGGYYSRKGRRQLLREVVDMMLSATDPYDALRQSDDTPRHPLRVAK
ncbi:capsular polysaccharide export protein [Cognatiyoonia sediminum]|uniref:Capsular polysaccharide export protein n=1 Tax=Cognatiyoonia sediminum TaxID=1508389 RepID=A0A1M5N205_9RHOB|nr:capsular biosynthesis protein [Cognatiyoonia sediminum]SHG83606.1 capsular polysaccharide export protein [Cognatiyoonia sediminum]